MASMPTDSRGESTDLSDIGLYPGALDDSLLNQAELWDFEQDVKSPELLTTGLAAPELAAAGPVNESCSPGKEQCPPSTSLCGDDVDDPTSDRISGSSHSPSASLFGDDVAGPASDGSDGVPVPTSNDVGSDAADAVDPTLDRASGASYSPSASLFGDVVADSASDGSNGAPDSTSKHAGDDDASDHKSNKVGEDVNADTDPTKQVSGSTATAPADASKPSADFDLTLLDDIPPEQMFTSYAQIEQAPQPDAWGFSPEDPFLTALPSNGNITCSDFNAGNTGFLNLGLDDLSDSGVNRMQTGLQPIDGKMAFPNQSFQYPTEQDFKQQFVPQPWWETPSAYPDPSLAQASIPYYIQPSYQAPSLDGSAGYALPLQQPSSVAPIDPQLSRPTGPENAAAAPDVPAPSRPKTKARRITRPWVRKEAKAGAGAARKRKTPQRRNRGEERRFVAEPPKKDEQRTWVRVNESTEGKTQRSGKLNQYKAEDFYTPQQNCEPWAADLDDGEEVEFFYNKHGELVDNPEDLELRTYTPEELMAFIEGHDGVNEEDHGQLTLWVQRTAADSARRYPSEKSNHCRLSCCPFRQVGKPANLRCGHMRVALDEKWDKVGRLADPYIVAGYVHLYCLERFLDLRRLCQMVNVRIDTREFRETEPYGKYAGRFNSDDAAVVAGNAILDAFKKGGPVPGYPADAQGRASRNEGTVNHAMQKASIETMNPSRLRTMDSRGSDSTMEKTFGDLDMVIRVKWPREYKARVDSSYSFVERPKKPRQQRQPAAKPTTTTTTKPAPARKRRRDELEEGEEESDNEVMSDLGSDSDPDEDEQASKRRKTAAASGPARRSSRAAAARKSYTEDTY